MILILMGVSGAGKTTIGKKLASVLKWEFIEADEFHEENSIRKMARGVALHDADRLPWLERLCHQMKQKTQNGRNLIVACSALKSSYRNILQRVDDQVYFIYLQGDYNLILNRLQKRKNHFMKADLLSSQYEALEEPEEALVVDASLHADQIINIIRKKFFPPL